MLPGLFRQLLRRLGEHLKELISWLRRWSSRFSSGIATTSQPEACGDCRCWSDHSDGMVASVGDARNFSTARQLAAWLGLVPRQHSSGGKSLLLGISKRGDYLRTLLIHGARPVIRCAGRRTRGEDPHNLSTAVTTSGAWLWSLVSRRGT